MTTFTTPAEFEAGDQLTAAQLNAFVRDNWLHATESINWNPTLTQSNSVSKTMGTNVYWQTGKRIHATCFATASSSGTSGQNILLSLPVTATTWTSLTCIGSGWIYDTSTATFYQGAVLLNNSTTCGIRINGQAGFLGAAPAFAMATGDIITVSLDYLAA